MSESIEVASLTAPIHVKIPKQQIEAFKQDLRDIQKMLQGIVADFREVEKSLLNIFTRRRSKLNIKVDHSKREAKQKETSPEEKEKEDRAKRVSKIYGEWADKLAQVRVIFGLIKFYVSSIAKTILVPTGMLAGLTLLAYKINSATAEMAIMADVSNTSMDTMRSLDLEARKVGMSYNNVKDVLEELNEKMGAESQGIIDPRFRQGLYLLNVDVNKLINLNPSKQLDLIMNASRRLYKQGKIQEVSTAFKSLFGGQSQMLLGSFVRTMNEADMSFQQLIESNLRAVSLSKDAVAGAETFARMLSYAFASLKTLSQEFFGKVGEALAPFEDTFKEIFNGLKEGSGSLFEFLTETVAEVLVDGFVMIAKLLDYLRSNSEEVKGFLSVFITLLKKLFQIGVALTKMFVAMSPALFLLLDVVLKVISVLTDWINTDIGRAIFSWIASIALMTFAVHKLFNGLDFLVTKIFPLFLSFVGNTIPTAVKALTVSLLNLVKAFLWMGRGILIASGALLTLGKTAIIAMAPMLLVAGKFLLIMGAIATVAYTTYSIFKKLFDLSGWTDFASNIMEAWFFNKENKELAGAKSEQQTREHIARFKANQARMQAVNNTNNTNNSSTAVTTYNTTNHVVVNDVTTGKAITKQIIPAMP